MQRDSKRTGRDYAGPRRGPDRTRLRYAAFVLVALGTLILTVWSATVLRTGAPMLGIELVGPGHVYQVQDEPARSAGLAVGDQVVLIDGIPLRNRVRIAGEKRVGDAVTVTYLRDATLREARIVLAPLAGEEYVVTLERLLLALLFWLIATGIWMLRPGEVPAQRFFLFSHLMAAYLSVETLDLVLAPASIGSDLLRLLIVPTLAHFLVLFPTPLPAPWHRRFVRTIYGLVFVLATLYVANAAAPSTIVSSLTYWDAARFLDIAILISALVVLLLPDRKGSITALRRRRAVVFGIVVGVLPTLVLTLVSRSVLGYPLLDYVWTFPFVAIIPISFAVAVYAGELGQFDWFINRTLVYVLLTMGLLAAYGAAFFGLSRFLSASPTWVYTLAGTALALIAGVLFRPVRNTLQRWVDRLFYGGWYDYRTFVEKATSELSRVSDRDALLDRLQAVCNGMRRHEIGIFMRQEDHFVLARCAAGLSDEQQQVRLPIHGALASHLRALGRPASSNDLREILSADGAEASAALDAFAAHQWVPMVSKDVLRGIMVVRDDRDDRMQSEDIAILRTLSRQAAVACENVALLDSLRERLEEVQHMNEELLEVRNRLTHGREQERLHLARELHDGPVQDVYAIMHRVEGLLADPAGSTHAKSAQLGAALAAVAETLRGICMRLRPPLLNDLGLEAALSACVEDFQEAHPQIRVTLQVSPGTQTFPDPLATTLYRIAQEAINNVAHHADAKTVFIRLEADAEQTLLYIRDDGTGFVVPERLVEMGRNGHLGLLGMRERAEAAGGRLRIESAPGKGTTIRVVVPALSIAEPAPTHASPPAA